MTLKKGLAALACAVLTAGAAAAEANFTDYGTARGWLWTLRSSRGPVTP